MCWEGRPREDRNDQYQSLLIQHVLCNFPHLQYIQNKYNHLQKRKTEWISIFEITFSNLSVNCRRRRHAARRTSGSYRGARALVRYVGGTYFQKQTNNKPKGNTKRKKKTKGASRKALIRACEVQAIWMLRMHPRAPCSRPPADWRSAWVYITNRERSCKFPLPNLHGPIFIFWRWYECSCLGAEE